MLSLVLALSLTAPAVPPAAAASAPAEVEIHYMPPGQKVYLPEDKAWGRGFNFGEYKLLLKMDMDLWDANKIIDIYKDIDLKYTGIVEQKDGIIQTLRDDIAVKDGRIKRVEENWHKAEQLAIDNAGGPIWPYILAGTGAVIGIIGATLYLSTLAN